MTCDSDNIGGQLEARAIGEVFNRGRTVLVGRVYLWDSGEKGIMWLNDPKLADTVIATFAWADWEKVMGKT